MSYALNLLIGVDQLVNIVVGGEPDETMSSHAYRMERDKKPWGFLRCVIDGLFFFQPNHCQHAYESELQRMQESPEFRR